jgi:glycosyltransferase involved in cell wall biosynthesis
VILNRIQQERLTCTNDIEQKLNDIRKKYSGKTIVLQLAVAFTIEGSGVNYVNLKGVTGIECANGDSKAFADAIIKLRKDKSMYDKYAENAKNRVINEFMFDKFQDNVRKLINDL